MVDAGDRPHARFPPDQEGRVTADVRAALQRFGVGPSTTVIGGAARGADLIALEQAADLGASLRVVLALPRGDFARRSVGDGWSERFEAALARAHEVTELNGSFAAANAAMLDASRSLDPQPHAVLVWNGRDGDGPGGTGDLVTRLKGSTVAERMRIVDPTPRSYEARQRAPGPKRLLALEGGGIRGALSVEILGVLEARLRERYGQQYVLGDFFDYVGGTSTGSIIAAALAFGRPIADVRRKYEELGPRVFRKRMLPARLRSLYRDTQLTKELVDFFGARRTLGDPDLRSLLLLVLHNSVTDSVWPLSNCTNAKYNRADRYLVDPPDRNLDLPLTALIRGSTAAPLYFPPQTLRIGGRPFVFQDGGVTPFNNPAMLMFLMATLPEYGLGWATGEDELLVVSVGTGSAAAEHPNLLARHVHAGFQIRSLPSVFMNGASVGQDLMCRAFGRTRAGDAIDLEFGSRTRISDDEEKAFTYLRYNADLSPRALRASGITDEREQQALRKLDAVPYIAQLQEIGRRVGEQIDLDAHFAGFLP